MIVDDLYLEFESFELSKDLQMTKVSNFRKICRSMCICQKQQFEPRCPGICARGVQSSVKDEKSMPTKPYDICDSLVFSIWECLGCQWNMYSGERMLKPYCPKPRNGPLGAADDGYHKAQKWADAETLATMFGKMIFKGLWWWLLTYGYWTRTLTWIVGIMCDLRLLLIFGYDKGYKKLIHLGQGRILRLLVIDGCSWNLVRLIFYSDDVPSYSWWESVVKFK